MKGVPTFRDTKGKLIYGGKYILALTNAVYAKKTYCDIDGETVNIISSDETNTGWDVVVEFSTKKGNR